MAEEPIKDQQQPAPRFKIADTVRSIRAESSRAEAAVLVSRSGLSMTNSEGAQAVYDLAEDEGLDRDQFQVKLGGDSQAMMVGVYVCEGTEPGAMPVRRNDNTITLYLHGVFKENPKLRPASRVECQMTRGKDADGKDCVLINMKGGLVKPKVSRRNRTT